jgi:hypothetical protein
MSEPPGPDPAMVRAARAYLTSRYAHGVEQLLWEDDAYPMSDLDAINAVRAAAAAAQTLEGPDLAAALVLVQAARLTLDQLEARVLQAAEDAAMSWETIASVLDLPSAALAEEHFRHMVKRESEPIDPPRHHHLSCRPAEPGSGSYSAAEEDSADDEEEAPEWLN